MRMLSGSDGVSFRLRGFAIHDSSFRVYVIPRTRNRMFCAKRSCDFSSKIYQRETTEWNIKTRENIRIYKEITNVARRKTRVRFVKSHFNGALKKFSRTKQSLHNSITRLSTAINGLLYFVHPNRSDSCNYRQRPTRGGRESGKGEVIVPNRIC